jgi:hypothetical protein
MRYRKSTFQCKKLEIGIGLGDETTAYTYSLRERGEGESE